MFAEQFANVRTKSPLIHNITNYVTVNDCINIGTLNSRTIESMLRAGKKANALGHPVVLDPVGAGASTLRTETAYRLLDEVLDQDIDILKRTKENVDREAFYRAADALVNAKKVYVLGAGSSLALATFMAHYLRLVFETVHLVEATSEATILQQMVHVGEGDAVIAISFPRYSKKAVKTMKYASSQKATTVAITDSPLSPLAQYASHVLLARSDMVSFVDSLVGPLSILNALIVTVAIKKKNEVADTLRKIEEIWDEYGVYEKVDEKGS